MQVHPSFTVIVPTAYGQMLVNRHDINQANAFFKSGVAVDHAEIMLLAQVLQLLGTDLTFIDVGANFGAYSLALSQSVGPRGRVHAFEPQRIIFNMLAGSVALNAITNVYCHHAALGDHEGRVEIPQFDYSRPLNFGSVEFSAEQREPLTQARAHDPGRVEYVPLTTIDRFGFDAVHLMKIDAEGMELQVLQGAANTIRKFQPVLYVEFLKNDKAALHSHLSGLGYAIHENGINFLCVPPGLKDRIRVEDAIQPPRPGGASGV